jgi:branched-chain amino acid aminotransferase
MKIQATEVIWFNGDFVPWNEAKVHVLSHALHYASSVFEGLRAYSTPRGPAIVCLAGHVRRLQRSCQLLAMPLEYSDETLCAAIRETVLRSGHQSCYIRPVVFRGYSVLGVDPTGCPIETAIATWPHGSHFGDEARAEGIDCGFSSWRRIAPDTLPVMAKSAANYVNSQLALLEAHKHGYHDAILLDVDGYACESHGANLFLVLEGTLYTPPLGQSVLGGVTRACVLSLAQDLGMRVREQRLAREMVATADEVFLSGTAAEVTPVRSIDGIPLSGGARGPLTERLQSEYLGIVKGEIPDRHGWLSYVTDKRGTPARRS